MAPAGPSSFVGRLKRRALTIPATALALSLFWALAPLILGAALLCDLARPARRRVALRLWCFVGGYLLANLGGQLALLLVWLSSGCGLARARLIRRTYALQAAWVALLFALTTRIWRLEWVVEGSEEVGPAPAIYLIRHASVLDTLIPHRFITRIHGIPLRFVLKRELLVDPCLDIAGHWLPNHFVDRNADDSQAELGAITELAAGLEPGEGLLIYPEGTRFSPAKRARILERLDARDPGLAARARALQHTLLPRAGGTLALMRAAPAADLVLCAHVGLDGFATAADLWSGELVGKIIHLRFWRHPAASLPTTDEARRDWLHARWAELDRWVDARRARV